MSKSAALALAEANKQFKATATSTDLDQGLTPAQSGTALWLHKRGGIELFGEAAYAVEQSKRMVTHYNEIDRVIARPITREALEQVAGTWFDPFKSSAATEVAAGYWLASVFHRGLDPDEVAELTDFLRSGSTQKKKARAKAVRRYPTGGISEKQALILPPLLMSLAKETDWCSPFLVARKLAHTGGTRDKLAVVPGFSVTDITAYDSWDCRRFPVSYFSAGSGFCLRDAEMYRIRGETGTVAEMGLMASSIMAKQAALPADSVIIDILYGQTAFLGTLEDADKFGKLCATIGVSAGLNVTPMFRNADTFLGHSVGSSTEVVEAAELLRSGGNSKELATAKRFIFQFAKELGLDASKLADLVETAIDSGDAFRSMLEIWRFHGANPEFLSRVEHDIREAFLGGLCCREIKADSSGTINWNPVLTADIVNKRVNSPQGQENAQSGNPGSIVKGGLEIVAPHRSRVSSGETIAKVYREASVSHLAFEGAYEVDE
ncbi:thymidine phosphorylase [Halospina denitrificans]|uniref:Thymidine phosphorylase n=1 Tax=Halospina denitrificans TaxID=332522 RepID=A0A4R7K0R6_9GAMM|nr:hypothetical protein [Halospina denitrificans]TDT44432.1 thymidine phosphorylase [Halospina denitrificans]